MYYVIILVLCLNLNYLTIFYGKQEELGLKDIVQPQLKEKKVEVTEKDEHRHFKKFLLKLGKDKLEGLSIIDVRELYEKEN